MAEYNEQYATINLKLAALNQISFVQVGYDTDGNFEDYQIEGEILQLNKVTRDAEALYAAFNTTAAGIDHINVIKIIGKVTPDADEEVLAYRPLGYTLDVERGNNAKISIHVTLFDNNMGQQEGSIELNYTAHANAEEPIEVHPLIDSLPYQTIDTATSSQFPLNLVEKGSSAFDPDLSDLQRKDQTPIFFAGRGHTYSNFLWYYWNPSRINNFLNLLANKFALSDQSLATYTRTLPAKVSTQNPFLGFNARYGSYLYWYNISSDYICVIYAGSNHYNAVDIFIVPNSVHITPRECQFFNNNRREFRIKFNRWYNHLYFVADNMAYQINTNLENSHQIYSQEIKENFDYFNSQSGADQLVYNIRAFQSEVQDAIQIAPLDALDDPSTKYYQLEFSDLGDVVVESYYDDGQTWIGIRNIFKSGTGYSWNFNERIDATDMYDNTDNNVLFNIFTIDNPQQAYRLMGLYQTSLVHLQYFLKNNYTPIYMGEEYSIGWSNVYQNYLTLFKTPVALNRRRSTAGWLDDTIWIEQGKIGHSRGLVEDLYSGATSTTEENYLAAERGVLVKNDSIGAYRYLQRTSIVPFLSWTRSGNDGYIFSSQVSNKSSYFISMPLPEDISLCFTDNDGRETVFFVDRVAGSQNKAFFFNEVPCVVDTFYRMEFDVYSNSDDIYLSFLIDETYTTNFPASSEFASKYWNNDGTLKEGCSIAIKVKV